MTIKGLSIAVSTMTCNERSKFKIHPDYGYGSKGFKPSIPPNTWLTFEIHLISWIWEDVSPNKDESITKQIIEPGVNNETPSSISIVNIHLEKEQNGCVVEERDVEFRLGEGKSFNICPGIEIALNKFKLNEKSRLFIHEKYSLWNVKDGTYFIGVYVIKLNYFEKVRICINFNIYIHIYLNY